MIITNVYELLIQLFHNVVGQVVSVGKLGATKCLSMVTFRWTASATHQGALWNFIPPTGKALHWSGLHMIRLKDELIVEVWAVQDTLGQLRQLSVTLERPEG